MTLTVSETIVKEEEAPTESIDPTPWAHTAICLVDAILVNRHIPVQPKGSRAVAYA